MTQSVGGAIYLPPNQNKVLMGQALNQLGAGLVQGYIQKAEQAKMMSDSQNISGWLASLAQDPNTPLPAMQTPQGQEILNQLNFKINTPEAKKNLELLDAQIGATKELAGQRKSSAKLVDLKADTGFDTPEQAIENTPIGPDGKPLLVKSVTQLPTGKWKATYGDRTAGMGSQTSQFLAVGKFQMPDPDNPSKMIPAAINKITGEPVPLYGITKPPTETEEKSIDFFENLKREIKTARNLYSPEYVGPIKGMELREYIMPGVGGVTKDEATFRNSVRAMRSYLYEVGGKQLSDFEIKFVDTTPTYKKGQMSFEAALDEMEKRADFVQNLKKSGSTNYNLQELEEMYKSSKQAVAGNIGDTVQKGGRTWKIVGFDKDGTPLVDEVK